MSKENFPDFEEHDEHPDERWLISYADMMTLLFGLFVLLFAMASMDQESAQRVLESTQKQFGSSERDPSSEQTASEEAIDMVPLSQVEELKRVIQSQINTISELSDQLKNEQEKISALIEENQQLSSRPISRPVLKDDSKELRNNLRKSQGRIAELENEIENLKNDDASNELKEHIRSLEKQLSGRSSDKERFASLSRQISQYRAQQEKYKQQLRGLNAKNKSLTAQNSSLTTEMKTFSDQTSEREKFIKKLQDQLDLSNKKRNELLDKTKEFAQKKKNQSEELSNQVKKLERELASTISLEDQVKNLQNRVSEAEKRSKDLESKNQDLARGNSELLEKVRVETEKNRGNQSKQAFLAFIISWSSRDHDIDLVIEDPSGKRFDFKNRKFNGNPGHFALDTRRGPGAELWQSNSLIPGRYKASYFFYNQYGNVAPASVLGTIFSPKGSVEIKPVEMDLTKNRKHEVIFDVDKDGKISVVSK